MLRLLCLVVALCIPLQVLASADELQRLLQGIHSLRGAFIQQLHGADKQQLLETSNGHFELLQPGYLRWHIEAPEEQLLVAGEGQLWHYDVELETATRRPFNANSPQSPLAILAGESADLTEYYRVSQVDAQPGERAWLLEPQFAQAEFVQLQIIFRGQAPVRMQVLDPLERTTTIVFSEIDLNPILDAAAFVFVPPAGTDIYEQE